MKTMWSRRRHGTVLSVSFLSRNSCQGFLPSAASRIHRLHTAQHATTGSSASSCPACILVSSSTPLRGGLKDCIPQPKRQTSNSYTEDCWLHFNFDRAEGEAVPGVTPSVRQDAAAATEQSSGPWHLATNLGRRVSAATFPPPPAVAHKPRGRPCSQLATRMLRSPSRPPSDPMGSTLCYTVWAHCGSESK